MKTYLINGCTGSLGRSLINKIFQENKYNNIIGISSGSNLDNVDQRISHISLDLLNIKSISPILKTKLNGSKIDVLLNCAGTCKSKTFLDRTPDDILSQININLTSTLVLTRIVLDFMDLDSKKSHIINISSLMGRIPNKYYTVYSSTKFGLVGFSESLRIELFDRNVKVSCILPSLFYSKMSKDAKHPKIIKPVDSVVIANEVYSIIGKHEGLKTIGLLSSLSCLVEKFLPAINRNISSKI